MLDKFRGRLLGAMLLVASPFVAADALAERISGEEAVVVMRSMGLSPELEVNPPANPVIGFHIHDLFAELKFYDCDNNRRCSSMQLTTALDLPQGMPRGDANYFNAQFRYGRIALDKDSDPYLKYDFDVLNTNAAAHLRAQLEMFGRLVAGLKEYVGLNQGRQ